MATSFVDALMGYEYFLEERGKVSQEEINDYLVDLGRSPISPRTYSHHRSLMANGFRSYFPINQFDVSRTLGQLQMAADRRRYSREQIDEMDCMVSKDRTIWVPAKVIDRSLVGFGMYTANPFQFKSRTSIWVRIDNYQDIPATLVWIHKEKNSHRFGIRAFEFIEKYQISKKETPFIRPTSILIVRKASEDGITWREIYRIMGKTNELIDASEVLLYSISKITNIDVKFSSTIILSMHCRSPFGVKLRIDGTIAEVIKVPLEKLQLWSLEKERYKEETRKIELENIMREIEIMRNAIRAGKEAIESGISQQMVDSLVMSIMRGLNIEQPAPPLFEPGSLEKGILAERLLPAAAELIAGDDPDIEVEVKENYSDETDGK